MLCLLGCCEQQLECLEFPLAGVKPCFVLLLHLWSRCLQPGLCRKDVFCGYLVWGWSWTGPGNGHEFLGQQGRGAHCDRQPGSCWCGDAVWIQRGSSCPPGAWLLYCALAARFCVVHGQPLRLCRHRVRHLAKGFLFFQGISKEH